MHDIAKPLHPARWRGWVEIVWREANSKRKVDLLAGFHGAAALIAEESPIHPGRTIDGTGRPIDGDVGQQLVHSVGRCVSLGRGPAVEFLRDPTKITN